MTRRSSRRVGALSVACAAAPCTGFTCSTPAATLRRGPPQHPRRRASVVAEVVLHEGSRHHRVVDALGPRESEQVESRATVALFWTESGYDPANGWRGRVRSVARNELHAPRTIEEGTNPSCLAVDSLARSVYWTDHGRGAIIRAPIDGGSSEFVAEGVFGHRSRDGPWGLAVDPSTSTLVWSAAGNGKIRRADLDGDNVQTISNGDTNAWSAAGPWGLAPDLRPGCAAAHVPKGMRRADSLGPNKGLGSVFWTSLGRVSCCELSNGKVRDVVRGLVDPIGLALDTRNRRVFWTDSKAGKVQCASLGGSGVCDVAVGLSEPWGIALGPTHIFWTERRRGSIMSCSLRTGKVSEILSGLDSPEGIGLLNGPVSPQIHFPSPRAAAIKPRFGRPIGRPPAAVGRASTATTKVFVHRSSKSAKPPRVYTGEAVRSTERPPSTRDIIRMSESTLAQIRAENLLKGTM